MASIEKNDVELLVSYLELVKIVTLNLQFPQDDLLTDIDFIEKRCKFFLEYLNTFRGAK